MNNDSQTRGHCPHCGNEQAVVRGRMSKHGYTVNQGYFSGVCHGHQHPPIETSRKSLDDMVAFLRGEAPSLRALADAIESGAKLPDWVKRRTTQINNRTGKRIVATISFADGTVEEQQIAIRNLPGELRSKASMPTTASR